MQFITSLAIKHLIVNTIYLSVLKVLKKWENDFRLWDKQKNPELFFFPKKCAHKKLFVGKADNDKFLQEL